MTIEYNPKDIVIGKARVCWGFSWQRGNPFEGWHLLGCRVTMSRDVAEAECAMMNIIMIGNA